jgi:hypothetical protein
MWREGYCHELINQAIVRIFVERKQGRVRTLKNLYDLVYIHTPTVRNIKTMVFKMHLLTGIGKLI